MTTETPELAWRCRRCGWQGETPDSAPVLNPATGDGYRAPCCPPCGQYFSQDDIDRAEAIRAGAANLPTAEIAPSPSPVVSEEMDPAFVRRVLAENGFLSTYSIQGQIDDAAMTVARALTASLSLAPAEAGWRTMESAPRDRRFVGAEFWDGQPKYVRIYKWRGPPDFWVAEDRNTCIRPDYQHRYLWSELPSTVPSPQEQHK